MRPKLPRFIQFTSNTYYFKPCGVPLRTLEEIVLFADEVEALKLHDVDHLDQIRGAERMKISQPTFGRILDGAYKKIAEALINGKAIRIERNM